MQTLGGGTILFLQVVKTATEMSFSLGVLCANMWSSDNEGSLGILLPVRERRATVLHSELSGRY